MFLAIKLGLSLSMNPFMLSSTLVYVTLLSFWRHTRRELVFSGIIYIGILWLTYVTVLLGGHDDLIYHPVFEKLILVFYSLLAVFWGVIGWRHLKARREQTRSSLNLPRVVEGNKKSAFKDQLFLVFCFMVAGSLSGLLEARLTQNYYLLIFLKRQVEAGRGWLALGGLLGYLKAYTVTLLACWIYFLISNYSLPVRMKIGRLASIERVGLAACYWAVSLGLIYYLLKVVEL